MSESVTQASMGSERIVVNSVSLVTLENQKMMVIK